MNTSLIKTIKDSFIAKFKSDPVVVFSPGRINIIGEYTDYNDGFVFPVAVDKGIVAAIQKSDSNTCIVYAADKDRNCRIFIKHFKTNGSRVLAKLCSWCCF